MSLFGRIWSLQIGDLLIDATDEKSDKILEVEFDIEKSLTSEPNTASIGVYMLQKANRDRIVSSSDVDVVFKIGHKGQDLAQIFGGTLRHAYNEWSNRTVITKIEGDDGGASYRNTVISASFGVGTSVLDVLKKAVDGLDIGRGNLSSISSVTLRNGESTYPNGTAIHGRARDVVTRLVSSCGLSWSVQDGSFQLRENGKPVVGTAIVLKSDTGLIGSPKRTENHDGKPPVVEVESLVIPGLYPGRIVVLESLDISGNFMVSKVKFSGRSSGAATASLTLKEY
jgi:hypothetical protein